MWEKNQQSVLNIALKPQQIISRRADRSKWLSVIENLLLQSNLVENLMFTCVKE